jgi:hypothetical protein
MAALRHDSSGTHRQAGRAAALSALAVVALTLLWTAPAARATTQIFSFTGAEQTFAVPGGVHSVGVVVIGGVGGSTADATGGEADDLIGNLTVTPGQTLYVEVGGKGKDLGEGGAGGFNGGAAGAGGGGGASDIRTSPRAAGLSPDTRLIVAAGGGGAGGSGPSGTGGDGGAAGSAGGSSGEYAGGGAGTATEGGVGASGCEASVTSPGAAGELGSGGAGGNALFESDPGGGGGGGLYGGGGGGGACTVGSSGGGGGSSLIPSMALQGLTSAAPKVEITYTAVPPSISIVSPAAGGIYAKGQVVNAIYSCTHAEGVGLSSCTGTVANGAPIDTSSIGSHNFTVEAEDTDGVTASESVTYTVVAEPPGPKPGAGEPPDTIIGTHPRSKIETKKKKVNVKFSFSSDPAGASFKCKLDDSDFVPCKSPQHYKVKAGRHVFEVEAFTATQVDPTPASVSFKVKRKPKKHHHPR